MKYSDINKMFTTEVNKYLAQGYRFNTASMNGSQGELAKVDLTNGTEIIRIVARTFSKEWDKQGVELFVGRVAEKEGIEAMMAVQGGWLRSTETDTYPFCVAWNGKPLSAGKEI